MKKTEQEIKTNGVTKESSKTQKINPGGKVMRELEAIKKIYKLGGHFVLCGQNKHPIHTGWNKKENAPTLEETIKHREAGGIIGVIAKSLNSVVIDVDEGGEKAIEYVQEKLGLKGLVVPSNKEGRFHIYYSVGKTFPSGNKKWKYKNFGGDVRFDKGFIILWNPIPVGEWLEQDTNNDIVDVQAYSSLIEKNKGSSSNSSTLQGILKKLESLKEGNRNNAINETVFQIALNGWMEREDLFKKVTELVNKWEEPLEETEVQSAFESGWQAGEKKRNEKGLISGKNKESLEKALEILEIEVRFEIRSQKVEFRLPGEKHWEEGNTRRVAHIRELIEKKISYLGANNKLRPLSFGTEKWKLCLDAILHEKEEDAFLEWLNSLPNWDNTPRLGNLFPTLFKSESNGLTFWAGKYLFLAAVQRAYLPGDKIDEIPIIYGPQGVGKSSLLSNMFPKAYRAKWFGDGLRLAADEKRRVESLLGRVLVEAAEMSGAKKAEIESLKSFLTCINDGNIRLAYRSDPEVIERRCIIVGTTNEKQCLPNDPSGNRRFVPVEVKEGSNIEKYMEENRNQLWAEAIHLFKEGERANLPKKLKQLQKEVVEEYRYSDEIVEDAIQNLDTKKGYKLKDIIEIFFPDDKTGRRLENRISKGLRGQKWAKRKVTCKKTDGAKYRGDYWVHPDFKGEAFGPQF